MKLAFKIFNTLIIATCLFISFLPKKTEAAWTDNAYDFVYYKGEQTAYYESNAFWFGQGGVVPTTGIFYQTIGWKVSVTVPQGSYSVSFKTRGTSRQVDERDIGERRYTLWKIPFSEIVSRLESTYPGVDFSDLENNYVNSIFYFDAIIRVSKNGVWSGDIDDYGKATNTVYKSYSSIASAAPWDDGTKSDLRNLFNISKTILGSNKPIIPTVSGFIPTNEPGFENKPTVPYHPANTNEYWVNLKDKFTLYVESSIPKFTNSYPYANYIGLPLGSDDNRVISYNKYQTTAPNSWWGGYEKHFADTSTEMSQSQNQSSNYMTTLYYLRATQDNKDYKFMTNAYYGGNNTEWNDSGKVIKTDGTAPSVNISPTVSNWTKDIVNVSLTASDTRSGVKYREAWLQKDSSGYKYQGNNITSLKLSESGIYDVKFQAADNVKNTSSAIIKSYKVDRTNPYYTSIEIVNVTDATYDVLIHGVGDSHSGVNRVMIPTWTEKNGQDDLMWYEAQKISNGEWKYTVNINKHNNERGKYNSHIYIYDNVGNYVVSEKVAFPIDVKVYSDYGNVFRSSDDKELYTSTDGAKWIRPNENFYVTTKGHSEGYQINENQVQIYNINNTSEKQIVKASIPRNTIKGNNSGWQDSSPNNTIKWNKAYPGNRLSSPSDKLNKGGTLNATGMHTELSFEFSLTQDNKDYKQGSTMVSFGNTGLYYLSNGGNFQDYNTIKTDGTAPTGSVNFEFNEESLALKIEVSNIVENRSGLNKIWTEYYPKGANDNIITETLVNDNGIYKGGKDLYNIFGEDINIIGVRVKAIDNVGNERVLSEKEFDTFNLNANIVRVLDPHDPVFKTGEKGILKINLLGGVEKVKINFPYELTQLDSTLNDEMMISPIEIVKPIDYPFFIPLEAAEKNYTVEVIGYKNGKEKKVYPTFKVTNGSVTDEVRTIIIYPGKDSSNRDW